MPRYQSVILFASAALFVLASPALANYGGAISYAHIPVDGKLTDYAAYCAPRYTAMRTRKRIVFEQIQLTGYKTLLERVWEQKPITVVRHVPETRYREVV